MAAAVAGGAADESYESMRALDVPLRLKGTVVKGFGRGSKELGIPTANLDPDALGSSLASAEPGVYFGWASVGDSPVTHKMVMSVGWNPFYKNERKTVEPHLLASFPEDFYGSELRLAVTAYMRPEKNYPSLEALVTAIHTDIETARAKLDTEPHSALREDPFLRPTDAAPAAAAGGAAAVAE